MPVFPCRRPLMGAAIALLALAGVAQTGLLSDVSTAARAASSTKGNLSLVKIKRLAANAYVWGLAGEFTWRFAKYNTTLSAPMNALTYGQSPAAWNNTATNAGDSSVIYINGFMDFSTGEELVLTVPPSRNQYYVVNYLDNYINTIGSIGTRTTPSDESTSYLLVGPTSKYARQKVAVIDGHEFPVMASDTNLNWMLIRILASTLADGSAPNSTPSVYDNVSKKFAMNTLTQFRDNGFKPVFPTNYTYPAPTDQQLLEAKPYKDTPETGLQFMEQLGKSVVLSPIPSLNTALGGTPVRSLPPYVVPQYGARSVYFTPSFGQAQKLKSFAPIGLTANGFSVPKGWGPAELAALEEGYKEGQAGLNAALADATAGASTNYWSIINNMIGTYPNSKKGYLVRATIVLNGGSANVPLDAVYPKLMTYNGAPLSGNNTYTLTFTPPVAGAPLPVSGIFPPQVTYANGKNKGFWSVTLYQPDSTEVAAPFLTQAAVLNTAYSTANTQVLSVNATNDTITVSAPDWGKIVASTPIIFGGDGATGCGFTNNVYYVAGDPVVDDTGATPTYTFPISETWIQELSQGNVPIQYSGSAGPIVDFTCTSTTGLNWGMLKPVAQLGSSELEDGKLVKNADGKSVTIWFAPSLPAGAPATNWIPTPSTAYYQSIYPGKTVSTTQEILMRTYYPTPGDQPPSILPYKKGRLPESYIPPALVQVATPPN